MVKKNILVIPTWYPNGQDKLMGIYHKEFCEALVKTNKVNVNMLYVDRQRLNKPFDYLKIKKWEVIDENDYKTYIIKMLNMEPISFSMQLKLYERKLMKAFKRYLKDNPKPDVLHAEVSIPAGYAACKLGEKYNIPVVVTEHASYYERFFKGKNKKYGDYVLEHAFFTTVSSYMLENIISLVKKGEVLPNLVDTENFKKERKNVDGLKLVTVSALRQGKRIDDLLEVVHVIVNKMNIKDVHLTIVGDGYLRVFYQNKCKELKLDKYVTFVGQKTKEEIATILNEHNIFVIASEKETFCIPGIEALASGLPIVCTKCLGPMEYLDEKSGVLVDVGDINGLAEAIMKVYHNLDKYVVEYLRSISDKYSASAVANKALRIYEKISKE